MERTVKLSDLIGVLEKKYFPKDWLKFPRLKKERENRKDLIVLGIISASKDILKYYHLLFLSGDYVSLVNDNEGEFSEVEKFLTSKSEEIDNLASETLKLELQSKFQDNIFYPFRKLIRPYVTYFVRDLRIQLYLEYKQGLFRGDKTDNGTIDVDESVRAYLESLRRLITLVGIEHFRYRLDNDLIRELLVIRKEMDFFSINNSLKEAISMKVSFLLRKLLYRNELSRSNDSSPEYIYSFDQQDDTTLSLDNIGINESLNGWDDLINIHYGLSDNYKLKQRKRRKEIELKQHDSYCYKDYHGLIKIYKDDTKNLEQTRNLLGLFEKQNANDVSSFDQYSRACTGAYLFNNYISLKCEVSSFKIETFKELLSDIRNRQNKDDIRNYFPWLKLAQTLTKEIDKISAELVEPQKYEAFKEYLKLFSTVIEKLEESFRWCFYKKFIPIQMLFDECRSDYIISTDGFKSVNLFFFSSFILPLDYKQIAKDRNSFSLKKQNYETLLSVYDKLQYVVGEVEGVSEKMRKQERRSIEVLAIFSAMALFSVGSIQIFSNNSVVKDPNVYYKFIMSFGYSLALFVLLIWIITRDNIRKVQYYHWIIVGLLFVGTCVVIGYFVGSPLWQLFEKASAK